MQEVDPFVKNWMSHIPNDKLISEISIPGTHDSAARFEDGIGSFIRCQDLTLTEQLNRGIRFFDIRQRAIIFKNGEAIFLINQLKSEN